ncbi:MAG: PAS domain S-box protein [Methanomassiliicoccales archaeon]|nr:MAG: PAS domain S-box protein [Methanomassiliicoccales archaeon]
MAKSKKTAKGVKKASKKKDKIPIKNTEKMVFLESILKAITDGITVIDDNLNIIYINQSLAHFFGYKKPEDIIGKKCYRMYQNRKSKCKDCPAIKVFDKGKPKHIFHTRIDGHGNETFWELYFYPIRDDKGDIQSVVEYSRNITREKRLEEQVKGYEKRLAELLSVNRDVIVEYNANMELTFISENIKDFSGYTSKEVLEAESFIDFVTPESKKMLLKYFKNRMAGMDVLQLYEIEFLHKSGRVIPVEVSVSPRMEGDRISGAVATVRDITERKETEKALRESEERYRAIFEQAADSIVLIEGSTGKLVEFNERAHETLGYTRAEFKNLRIPDFEVIESTKDVRKHIKKIIKEGSDQFETKHRTKSGEVRDILVTCRAISIGGSDFLQGIWRDITESKRAEEALKESEEKYSNLFQKSNDAIFLHDLDGNVIDVNQRVLDFFGYSKKELLGLKIPELHPPHVLEASRKAFKKISKKGYVNFEIEFKRKSGDSFPAEVSSSLFEIADKKVIQGIVRDITERKKADRKLKESEEKYRMLLEQSGDVITYFTVDGILIAMNQNAARGLNGIPDDFVGKSLDEMFDEDIAKRSLGRIRRVAKTLKSEVHEDMVDVPIGKGWYQSSYHPMIDTDKNVTGVQIISHNISDRKEAEEEIKKLKEFNESIVQSMSEGIIILDEEGYVSFINPKIEKVLGYKGTKLVGEHWENIIAPDYHRRMRDCYSENLLGEQDRFEAILVKKNRTEMPVLISASPHIKDGLFSGILAVITDITDRKREDIAREELMRYKIRRGSSYLIKEKKLERGKDIIYELYKNHFKGLVITREHPEKMKRDLDLNIPIYWMTNDPKDKASIRPEFSLLEKIIDDNIDRTTFILLDRFDYLVTQNNFKDALNFVQHLNEIFYARKAILIISIDPETVSAQELSLLEKETSVLEKKHEERLSADLMDLLEFVNRYNRVGESPSYKQVGDEFRISRTTVRKRIRELVDKGLLKERKSGRFKYLVLTEKGKDSL